MGIAGVTTFILCTVKGGKTQDTPGKKVKRA